MPESIEGDLVVRDAKVAVVVSRFNDYLTEHMLKAAVDTWRRAGGDPQSLTVVHVPGSLELAVTARKLAQSGRYRAIVCLGCIIRGSTDHYDHVAEQTARGIREVGTQIGVPCIFGVITAETLEQAIDRAGGKMGNQGGKAMLAAIEMANLMKTLDEPATEATTSAGESDGGSGDAGDKSSVVRARHVRRRAMQLLYEIDLRGGQDIDAIERAMADDTFDSPRVRQAALALARDAWQRHEDADALIEQLAPHWPPRRQPPLDRAILRLAYHEMVTGHAPVKVAINEAIELAKQYCSEQSPMFINGVLDKMARQMSAAR